MATEYEKERDRRRGVESILALHKGQEKQTTSTMKQFHDDDYILRIQDEYFGYLTVLIKERASGAIVHQLRFLKAGKKAVGYIYNFARADRLYRLFVEPDLIPVMEADAKANPPRYA